MRLGVSRRRRPVSRPPRGAGYIPLEMCAQPQTSRSAPGIAVRCRFFARYAEAFGVEGITLLLPAPATAADAVAAVRARFPAVALPARPLIAVNREHVLLDAPLAADDEVAFLPPLAGG